MEKRTESRSGYRGTSNKESFSKQRRNSYNRNKNSRRNNFNRDSRRGNGTNRSYGQNRFRNSNRYGGGRRNFSRGRGSSRRNNRYAKKIDHSQYVYKVVDEPVDQKALSDLLYVKERTYSDFNLAEKLKQNITNRDYTHPTKIQDQSIPHILEGKDLLGMASTGSGKTAAFLIPMIDKIHRDRTQRCLIIVPTRELATQIRSELFKFNDNMRIFSTLVIGGASANRQISDLRRKPHFVIGTPGRLKDLSERGELRLNEFNNVVLDEVDRMLDMGFVEDIKEIISNLSNEKQSLFFSATMNRKSEEIARSLLKDPVKVQVAKQSAHKNVDQDIIKTNSQREKMEVLHELLIQDNFEKVLVFSRTKRGSDRLSRDLFDRGFKVDSIHGDKTQFKRDKVIQRFRENRINILVATDVAARGLDINNVTHVINYDEPATYEDYIHRIGRTGRAGKKGTALTFV